MIIKSGIKNAKPRSNLGMLKSFCIFTIKSQKSLYKSILEISLFNVCFKAYLFGIKPHIFPAPVFPRELPIVTFVILFHLCAPSFIKTTF